MHHRNRRLNPRVAWRRNADTYEQGLRRRAVGGDPEAAHALAQALLRSNRLTVTELVALGEPAADALPDELRKSLVMLLAPRIWSVVHTWDDPGRGPGTSAQSFLTEASAQREAAQRALGIVHQLTDDMQNLDPDDYEQGEVIEGVGEAQAALEAGAWSDAWNNAQGALASLDTLSMNPAEHQIRIDWQQGLRL